MGITFGTAVLISTGVTIAATWYQSEQQKKAAEAQQDAIDLANARLEPWRKAQLIARGEYDKLLEAGPGEYEESQAFRDELAGGVRALDMSASRRGRVRSGGHERAITRYGQGVARQHRSNWLKEYYDKLNSWAKAAGIEPPSISTEHNAIINAGQRTGLGYINQGNTLAQGAQTIGDNMWDYWLINQLPRQSIRTPGTVRG